MVKFLVVLCLFLFGCSNPKLMTNSVSGMDETVGNMKANWEKLVIRHREKLQEGYRVIDVNTEIKIRVLKSMEFPSPEEKLQAISDAYTKKAEQVRELTALIGEFDAFVLEAEKNFTDYREISQSFKNYLRVMDSETERILEKNE